MRETPNAFFSQESVPEGFTWIDPSHMQKEQMGRLLDHWLQRQDNGLVGLQFTGCSPAHYRRRDYRRKTRDYQDNEGDVRKRKNGKPSTLYLKSIDPILPTDSVDPSRHPSIDPNVNPSINPSVNPSIDPSIERADTLDPNAPFSMLEKSAEERITYLRTLCMDDHYTAMIDTLHMSNKVGSLLKFTSLC